MGRMNEAWAKGRDRRGSAGWHFPNKPQDSESVRLRGGIRCPTFKKVILFDAKTATVRLMFCEILIGGASVKRAGDTISPRRT